MTTDKDGKLIVKLAFQYGSGIILKSNLNDTYLLTTGIKVIDDDEVLDSIDEKVANILFVTCKEDFPEPDMEKMKPYKEELLTLIGKAKDRLAKINDGNYVVEDNVSKTIEAL